VRVLLLETTIDNIKARGDTSHRRNRRLFRGTAPSAEPRSRLIDTLRFLRFA